jgi:hypothetical protein
MNRNSFLTVLAVAAAVAIVLPTIAVAGKGKPGGGGTTGAGGSVSLVQITPRAGGPAIGDYVTFQISTSDPQPYVRAQCFVGRTLVYSQTHGFYASYPWGQTYRLGPTSLWTSGSASCRADLITAGNAVLATTSFSVSG